MAIQEFGMTLYEEIWVVNSKFTRNVKQAECVLWHEDDLPSASIPDFLNFCPKTKGT